MDTLERLDRLMGALDAQHRDLLAKRAREVLDAITPADNHVLDGDGRAGQAVAALGQLMDRVEANWALALDFGRDGSPNGDDSKADDLATRFLAELESCITRNDRAWEVPLATRAFGSDTVRRLHRLFTDGCDADLEAMLYGLRRSLRDWRRNWTGLEQDRRIVGMWRVLLDLTARLDAVERLRAEERSQVAGRAHRHAEHEVAAVTAEQAAEIAVHFRGAAPADMLEDWWRPIRVTEDAPTGLCRTWPEEPAWYVWFLPRFVGPGSSEVIVV